jgi:glutamate/tyrosine decarboxylase-like PLP-dependent enzyme
MADDSPFAPRDDPLALDADAMRALGHRTVDAIVDMLVDPATACLTRATPEEMNARLPAGDAPEAARDFEALLEQLRDDVFPFMSRLDHPGYFAFIPACGTFPSALGDFMAAVLNPYVGVWMEAAGPSRLELVVLDWFKRWVGYPDEAAGVLVSGGSAANMTALACARDALLGPMDDSAVAYVCDQAHSSMARAARVLGFRPEQLRVLPAGSDLKLHAETLAEAVDADASAGRRPLFAAAAAGATSTGSIDQLPELAAVCRARGIWLHVDAAYGGFAAMTERGRAALAGIELADSVTLDPHKWLYQPFECGSLLVRDGRLLQNAFEIAPDYLKDAAAEAEEEVNFADRGMQLSRGSRALKIWLSVSFFGVAAFRAAIDRALDLALVAEQHVRDTPELELLSPASLGITCFRRRGPDGEDEQAASRRNALLVREFERTGRGLVSSTRIGGRYAIRLCVMNHTSAEEHVRGVLDWFARAEAPGEPARNGASPPSRHTPVHEDSWLNEAAVPVAELARVPLFGSLDDAALERVAGWGREVRMAPGAEVTKRWDAARDFYVVLEGAVVVERDGEPIAMRRAGDFFGELAALDWGAGFGYARLATIRAAEPLRLLALSPAHLAQLMAEVPAVDEEVRRAVRERLPSVAG